jgi:hypothetical protein
VASAASKWWALGHQCTSKKICNAIYLFISLRVLWFFYVCLIVKLRLTIQKPRGDVSFFCKNMHKNKAKFFCRLIYKLIKSLRRRKSQGSNNFESSGGGLQISTNSTVHIIQTAKSVTIHIDTMRQ